MMDIYLTSLLIVGIIAIFIGVPVIVFCYCKNDKYQYSRIVNM